MTGWRPSRAAQLVDSLAPSAGRYYRQLRNEKAASNPHVGPFGIKLAGREGTGEWEEDKLRTFLACLDRSDLCVDVGANIGLYTCLAAVRKKRVIAVEPLPSNLLFLYRNLRYNMVETGVEVFPVGLSHRPGITRIYGKHDVASLVKGWAHEHDYYEDVPTIAMDRIIGKAFTGVQLTIKLDVEGSELEVLRGATETLDLDPKPFWIVEVFLNEPTDAGVPSLGKFKAVFDTFWSKGYRAKLITPSVREVDQADVDRWLEQGSSADLGPSNFLFSEK